MKFLVETTGQFMLVDPAQVEVIEADRPSVVSSTSFVQQRVSLGQIKILAELKDDASDMEFRDFVRESEGDMPLAVESFLSKFGKDAITEKGEDKPAAKKPGPKPKAKAEAETSVEG